MATDPRRTELGAGTGARPLQVGDLLSLRTPEYEEGSVQITIEVVMISGFRTEALDPRSLHAVSYKSTWVDKDDDTPLKVGDRINLTSADSMVVAEIHNIDDRKVKVNDIPQFRVVQWLRAAQSAESVRATGQNTVVIGGANMGPAVTTVKASQVKEAKVGRDVGADDDTATRRASTPRGKVKASFNLLREDIDALRVMATRLGTTVTNVLQRAIRDERFIQEELQSGNKFAVVDPEGTVREIIWR